jgi:pimeloyl-ACP methyl ester carboxylesterase
VTHPVLIIPGLGDSAKYIERATRHWPEKHGLEPIVHPFGWFDPLETYEEKLEALHAKIAGLGSVAVFGISAGGSLAINSLHRWPDQVTCAIDLCGPVRITDPNNSRLVSSPLLRHSIEEVSSHELHADAIMTLAPLYDEAVAVRNVPVEGAKNIRMKSVGHVFSILLGLYGYSQKIAEFIDAHAELK